MTGRRDGHHFQETIVKRTPLKRKTPLKAKIRLKSKKRLKPISKKTSALKKKMRAFFHDPVIKRDEGYCVYCRLFHGRLRLATYGDHILTQAKFPEFKLEPWNGVATCDECNWLRSQKHYTADILGDVRDEVLTQFVRMGRVGWFRAVWTKGGASGWLFHEVQP